MKSILLAITLLASVGASANTGIFETFGGLKLQSEKCDARIDSSGYVLMRVHTEEVRNSQILNIPGEIKLNTSEVGKIFLRTKFAGAKVKLDVHVQKSVDLNGEDVYSVAVTDAISNSLIASCDSLRKL